MQNNVEADGAAHDDIVAGNLPVEPDAPEIDDGAAVAADDDDGAAAAAAAALAADGDAGGAGGANNDINLVRSYFSNFL